MVRLHSSWTSRDPLRGSERSRAYSLAEPTRTALAPVVLPTEQYNTMMTEARLERGEEEEEEEEEDEGRGGGGGREEEEQKKEEDQRGGGEEMRRKRERRQMRRRRTDLIVILEDALELSKESRLPRLTSSCAIY